MFSNRLETLTRELATARLLHISGYVTEVHQHMVRAVISGAKLGANYAIATHGDEDVLGEVVTVKDGLAIMSVLGSTQGIVQGAKVTKIGDSLELPLSTALLGRVVDTFLKPIDRDASPLPGIEMRKAKGGSNNAMKRPLIAHPFVTGIRVIDALLTIGVGQRVAILGPPGTGKSSLLGMLAQRCEADVIVVALVGERGREVREFFEDVLPQDKRSKVVIVASTSETSASERALCAFSATTVAEYFRDQGKNVLLMVDSLTRTARALREIGLAAGEPPTRRGYPSSVYPILPTIIERAGRAPVGSITAVYTVLTEGEVASDPIAEEVKSLTDGHILLNRELAEAAHYPAIDPRMSLSRTMPRVVAEEHVQLAGDVRRLLAKFDDVEMLVQLGEYVEGRDKEADRAIKNQPALKQYFQQAPGEAADFDGLISQLRALTS